MKCVSNSLYWGAGVEVKRDSCKQVEQKTNKNTVSHLGKQNLFISLMYSVKSFKVQPNSFPNIFYFLIGKKSSKGKFLSCI